jgi:flagellar hook-associated protein 1 FlgK
VMDGMTIDVGNGTAVPGDSFMLNPARDASNNFALSLRDPRKFAAAGAVSQNTPASNAGTSALQGLRVTDPAALPLGAPLNLVFDPDAAGPGQPGFLVNGGADGVLAYDPATELHGKDFTLGAFGITFRISGTPQAGDSFRLGDNTGAHGDNGNAQGLIALQQANIVDGSRTTLQQYYAALVAEVGIDTRQASANLQVESSLLEQAEAYRDGFSGVNLDEEASQMLFQVLLDAVRR